MRSLLLLQAVKFGYVFLISPVYTWIVAAPEHVWTNACQGGTFGCPIVPYGLPWYGFYYAISRLGYWPMMLALLVIDTIILCKLKPSKHTSLFAVSGLPLFMYAPGDLLVLWIAALAWYKPLLAFLATVTKLPWPAPAYVWDSIVTVSLHQPFNYWRYALLSAWILSPLVRWFLERN